MEQIPHLPNDSIEEIILPTVLAFNPLLKERARIQEIPRRTFHFGPTDRHQLDVYYPIKPATDSSGKTRIFVFIYGGGYVSGERQLPAPFDLAYACVGAYYAHRGFITVIPDYRLVPNVIFPRPAEDVRDAVLWVANHPEHLTTPTTPNPDTEGIFLMGHSAGTNHVFTALILETAESASLRSKLAGVVLAGGAYRNDDPSNPPKLSVIIEQYWGSSDEAHRKDPLRLLQKASASTVAELPRILLVVAEYEPEFITKGSNLFQQDLEVHTGTKPEKIVAKGHNHISITCALGTREGEEWAEETIKWINASSPGYER